MNIKHVNKLAALSLVLWATLSSPAYAYLDPGTGSLLLQGLLGGIAGVAVFARIYWHKLVGWLGMTKPGKDNDGE